MIQSDRGHRVRHVPANSADANSDASASLMTSSIRHSTIALFIFGIASCRAPTLPAPATPTVAPAPTPAVSTTVAGPAFSVPDPLRFQQDILLEGVFDEPTEIGVARDGRVFIAERAGALTMYDPRTREQRLIARLAVNHDDENGLIGIALDPGFEQNHWLYVNYSRADEHHRLARFTLDGDSLRDERMLLEVKFDKGCCHTGGSIAFDGAGHLFVSYGDNTNPFIAGDYARTQVDFASMESADESARWVAQILSCPKEGC